MDKRSALEALEAVLKQAEAVGAKPGDRKWQPRIERAWRRALDAGIHCHIHELGSGKKRWMLEIDVGRTPELDPPNDRRQDA